MSVWWHLTSNECKDSLEMEMILNRPSMQVRATQAFLNFISETKEQLARELGSASGYLAKQQHFTLRFRVKLMPH